MPDEEPNRGWFTEKVALALLTALTVGFGCLNTWLNTRANSRIAEVNDRSVNVEQHAEKAAVTAERAARQVDAVDRRVKEVRQETRVVGAAVGAEIPPPKKDE